MPGGDIFCPNFALSILFSHPVATQKSPAENYIATKKSVNKILFTVTHWGKNNK